MTFVNCVVNNFETLDEIRARQLRGKNRNPWSILAAVPGLLYSAAVSFRQDVAGVQRSRERRRR